IENQRIVQHVLRETQDTMNRHCASATEINDENNFSWNEKAILLMLEEYKKRAERFRNPKSKKKQLWQEISDEMTKYGYKVDADVIDKKFRNMKTRYLIIKDNNDKKKTTGTGRISWAYFDIMSEIFFDDRTVNPNFVIASTVLSNNNNNNKNETEEITTSGNIPENESIEENDNMSSTSTSSSVRSNIFKKSIQNKKIYGKRNKPIDNYRKKCIDIEEDRIKELRKLREAVENNNTIQREKLEMLKQYLLIQQGNLINLIYF
ncbi:uncharacterized protein LOC112639121, partial [Camponotus floridanus]|uniref:uncharacterized protein LOC112639121 n=1 Tax=Camponotus floridanus TaxID=104421 RepID=UPI000DC6B379